MSFVEVLIKDLPDALFVTVIYTTALGMLLRRESKRKAEADELVRRHYRL